MRTRTLAIRTIVLLVVPLVLVTALLSENKVAASPTPGGGGQAVQRPIEDFLVNQGTYCFPNPYPPPPCLLFVPPIQNFMGWSDPQRNLLASVDYAGLADQWITAHTGGAITFGTRFSGGILERPLPDGRAAVTVRLFTHNALCWVVEGDNFATSPLVFGCLCARCRGRDAAGTRRILLGDEVHQHRDGRRYPTCSSSSSSRLRGRRGRSL